MKELLEAFDQFGTHQEHNVPLEIIWLLAIVGVIIFLWDIFDRQSKSVRKSTGLDETIEMVALRGSDQLPGKRYESVELGLSSNPDALIREDGFLIPVDIKPTGKKVQDRHVVELLAHMTLIEHTEGVRPPYGVLLMGPEQRLVRIKNAPEKQRWLASLLDEMRSIMDGIPAVPKPAKFKCKMCDVREVCDHSAFTPLER